VSQISNGSDDVHQHSGWWFPAVILLAVALLCGVFLLYDLRPGPAPKGVGRTGDMAPVSLSIGRARLVVPANYLDSRSARAGGAQDVVTMSALIPDMRGYTPADARLFYGNAPDSPVVHLQFKAGEKDLGARERLQRIYGPYLADTAGKKGGFGLTQYAFHPDSGYSRFDLFAGQEGGRLLLFLCERAEVELPSPNCLVTGQAVAGNVGFSWRFKRAYLTRWQEIAGGVDHLLARFAAPERSQ
jgi:hypothetical protein